MSEDFLVFFVIMRFIQSELKKDFLKDGNSLGNTKQKIINYLYTYAFPKDERSLCALEMRSMFGVDTTSNIVESMVEIDPSRSPFIKERIAVLFEETSLQELLEKVATLKLNGATFKVIYVKNASLANADKEGYELVGRLNVKLA